MTVVCLLTCWQDLCWNSCFLEVLLANPLLVTWMIKTEISLITCCQRRCSNSWSSASQKRYWSLDWSWRLSPYWHSGNVYVRTQASCKFCQPKPLVMIIVVFSLTDSYELILVWDGPPASSCHATGPLVLRTLPFTVKCEWHWVHLITPLESFFLWQ